MTKYEQPELTYDDITEDLEFITASRTVTEADIMQFAGLTGDYNELHTSEAYAKNTSYEGRIAHGMLTLSIANGLYMRMNLFEKNTVANLGIEEWKFVKPVRSGDTLSVRLTVAGKRLTHDPNRGIIRWNVEVLEQNKDVKARGIWVKMFLTRIGAETMQSRGK